LREAVLGCGKEIASYLGLVPQEDSSGERRRLGHISKQGNSLLRFLLVESTQVTVRSLPQWRSVLEKTLTSPTLFERRFYVNNPFPIQIRAA
jgi:transposase